CSPSVLSYLGDTRQSPRPPVVCSLPPYIRLAGRVPRKHRDPPQLTGPLEAAVAGAPSASREPGQSPISGLVERPGNKAVAPGGIPSSTVSRGAETRRSSST